MGGTVDRRLLDWRVSSAFGEQVAALPDDGRPEPGFVPEFKVETEGRGRVVWGWGFERGLGRRVVSIGRCEDRW